MQIFSVSELADAIKQQLDANPGLANVWVTGEALNVFRAASGHRYFTLKDAHGQLGCVHFSSAKGAQFLADGAQVNLHGRVSFYPPRGQLQFYADVVTPAGQGLLAAEFERVRALLEAEGLFEPSRKRALPLFPRRIGVVTSRQGAVIHDIARVLRARYPMGELVLCDTLVQGEYAPADVVDAIRAIDATPGVDVIIVARGGGSLEDLWAFNTEEVARAIHACRAPVVTGIGHEPDTTIADYAADLRAPTPTAAAAAAGIPDADSLRQELAASAGRALAAARHHAARRRQDVDALRGRLRQRVDAPTQRQRIDELLGRGRAAFTSMTRGQRGALAARAQTYPALSGAVRLRREQVASLERALHALNPASVMARGFAVVTSASGKTIVSADEVRKGDLVRATLKQGAFEAQVQ